jgi:hypothetical protein
MLDIYERQELYLSIKPYQIEILLGKGGNSKMGRR